MAHDGNTWQQHPTAIGLRAIDFPIFSLFTCNFLFSILNSSLCLFLHCFPNLLVTGHSSSPISPFQVPQSEVLFSRSICILFASLFSVCEVPGLATTNSLTLFFAKLSFWVPLFSLLIYGLNSYFNERLQDFEYSIISLFLTLCHLFVTSPLLPYHAPFPICFVSIWNVYVLTHIV